MTSLWLDRTERQYSVALRKDTPDQPVRRPLLVLTSGTHFDVAVVGAGLPGLATAAEFEQAFMGEHR